MLLQFVLSAFLNVFKKGRRMDRTVIAYVIYLVVSIGLTVWVARTLSRNGRIFLSDVLRGTRNSRRP